MGMRGTGARMRMRLPELSEAMPSVAVCLIVAAVGVGLVVLGWKLKGKLAGLIFLLGLFVLGIVLRWFFIKWAITLYI